MCHAAAAAATNSDYALHTIQSKHLQITTALGGNFFLQYCFYFVKAWWKRSSSTSPSHYLFNTCGAVGDSVRADVSHGELLCVHSNRPPRCSTALSFIRSSGACPCTVPDSPLGHIHTYRHTQAQKSDCVQEVQNWKDLQTHTCVLLNCCDVVKFKINTYRLKKLRQKLKNGFQYHVSDKQRCLL